MEQSSDRCPSSNEGHWPPHSVPVDTINRRYDVAIDRTWVDRVRLGSVKLYSTNSTSCGSAAIVSPNGLVLTCHHCVGSSLADASTPERDLLATGWLARRQEDEIRCESRIADVLIGAEDVTEQVRAATSSATESAAPSTLEVLAGLEASRQREAIAAGLDDEVLVGVTLYGGAEYWLYRYRRFTDVRLVFAPELAVAAFGGDVDNLRFPRWCMDVALVRLYRHGAPASTPDFLTTRVTGLRPGETVVMAGNPMYTDRGKSMAELEFKRRLELPRWLLLAAELRGRYRQYAQLGRQAARVAEMPCLLLENWLKIKRMQLDALLDPQFWERLRADEVRLRMRLAGDAELTERFGDPWADLSKIQANRERMFVEHSMIELGHEWAGQLVRHARVIVRGAAERTKPDSVRQREFAAGALSRVEQALGVEAEFEAEYEALHLQFWLERLQEWLGPRHPLVARHLMQEPLAGLAVRIVTRSALTSVDERLRLWKGGLAAVEASDDPLILLVRAFEPHAVAIRDRHSEEVAGPLLRASERLNLLRFAIDGKARPPDATATLRLSPGRVEGWSEQGQLVATATRLGEIFDRATGTAPFRLPDRWVEARDRLRPETPFNVVTTTDLMPGNSGSPLLDAQANVVGTVFDGNQHSMAGAYAFDESRSRTISVDLASLTEVLDKIYGATELLEELLQS